MRSVRSTSFIIFLLLLISTTIVHAQENSPYSRYGLGDIYPSIHVAGRAMGGLFAAATEYDPHARQDQNGGAIFYTHRYINFNNPASYANIKLITYDLGVSIDDRKLKSGNPLATYNSASFIPAYIAIGLPVKKLRNLSMAAGLRPLTRINYNILTEKRLAGIDSMHTIYEGSGGLNQFFIGAGKKWGNFSLGINGVYNFGRRELMTKTEFINDTVQYYKGQHSTTTFINGFGLEGGAIYEATLKEMKDKETGYITGYYLLRAGVAGAFKQNLNAKQDVDRQTYVYDGAGGTYKVDSVYTKANIPGKVVLPSKLSIGLTIEKRAVNTKAGSSWSAGIQYDLQQWGSEYKFMGVTDRVINSNMFRIGGEITPNHWAQNAFSRMTYRLGFYTGKDYINADNNKLRVTAFTAGIGVPLFNRRSPQFSMINTAVEVGKRGSAVNNITENYVRFSLSLSLSDIWFIKRKYD